MINLPKLHLRLTGAISFISRGLLVITLTVLLATAAGPLMLRAHGQRLLSVQTGSMVPTFYPGDAVIVKPVAPKNLQVGNIISYQSPRDPDLIISHRLIRIDKPTGWLTTAGDALRTSDPAFPPRLVVGQVTAVAPKLGTVLDALRRPLGLGLVVYLPATIIIISEIQRLIHRYRHQRYRLLGYNYISSRRQG